MCNDGKLRFDFTTNSVNVKLTRCLAKIEFNFELNTEDITIESVQLKNIDRSLYYLEPILRQRTDRPYKYIDYEKHTDNLPKYKETVTYEWYVPRNTSETRVGGDNNKSATYIEVIAKDKVGTFYKYKVYPGSKLQSSYDIIENRKYIINVKFNGVKDVDSNPNLTEFEILDLKDKLSNCYIINPSTKTKHIRIPVTRVNQFWNDSKYGAIDQTKVFDNSTPWKIDLVWTDNQNIISRTENNKILIEKNYGEGIDDYFEIVVPANFNTYGNIFVGIYKDEDDSGTKNGTETYLWTWHLWVTNYNPYSDNIFTPYSGKENNKYIYNVNNGELHRYNGDAWTNGIYSDKFIMDRNLGAITNSQYAWPVYSLYYQYGRMIPTVGEYVGIYKFNSDNINNSNTEWLGQGLIAKSSTQLSMRDAIDKNTTFIFTSP